VSIGNVVDFNFVSIGNVVDSNFVLIGNVVDFNFVSFGNVVDSNFVSSSVTFVFASSSDVPLSSLAELSDVPPFTGCNNTGGDNTGGDNTGSAYTGVANSRGATTGGAYTGVDSGGGEDVMHLIGLGVLEYQSLMETLPYIYHVLLVLCRSKRIGVDVWKVASCALVTLIADMSGLFSCQSHLPTDLTHRGYTGNVNTGGVNAGNVNTGGVNTGGVNTSRSSRRDGITPVS